MRKTTMNYCYRTESAFKMEVFFVSYIKSTSYNMPARKKKEKVEVVKEDPAVDESKSENIEKIPESKQPNVPHVINQIIQQVQLLTKQIATLNSNIEVVKNKCENEVQSLKG